MSQPSIIALLKNARAYQESRRPPSGKIPLDPAIADSPSIKAAIAGVMETTGCSRVDAEDGIMRARNCGEILTHEELAARLKVDVSWLYEKTRKRCRNPIPCMPIGNKIRFDWDAVSKWLEEQAQKRNEENQPKKAGKR